MTRPRLDHLPRVPLAHLPTPLHRLARFGEAIGAEVWIKRDDVGPVGLAGNTRCASSSTCCRRARPERRHDRDHRGRAVERRARHGRGVRAARPAVRAGVERRAATHPGGQPAARRAGRCGRPLRPRRGLGRALRSGAGDQRRRAQGGATSYLLPAGASSPLGALGFATAWLELQADLRSIGVAPDVVPDMPGYAAGLAAGAAEIVERSDVQDIDIVMWCFRRRSPTSTSAVCALRDAPDSLSSPPRGPHTI